MKIRFCAALLLAALALTALTGCQASAMDTLDSLEETIENRLDKAEDAIERAVKPEPTQPAATAARITAEEAESIALGHAGVNREGVTYLRTEFDYDDGRPEYDIDFICDGWEYEYEIHAQTGEILRSEAEPREQKRPASTEPSATEAPATSSGAVQTASTQPAREQSTEPPATQAPAAELLTETEARDIALKHAGLTADQVKGLKIEFDYDDGRPEYEVDFRFDGYEYDYEIHAQTGKILSSDKDRDD